MDDYVVISKRVLTGTMGDLPATAWRAWIAVLFEAEKLDGKVKLPVRDLARLASITIPEAAEALLLFQEPDEYSNSRVHEGRRLLPIEGEENWYMLATWDKHQDEKKRYFARLRQQRLRLRKRGEEQKSHGVSRSVTLCHAAPLQNEESNGVSRIVTKEPEPELKEESTPLRKRTKRACAVEGTAFAALWSEYPRKRGRARALRSFCAQIKTDADLVAITSAVANYKREVEGRDESKILHGSTFFAGEWTDYADGTWEPPKADSTKRDSRGFPDDGQTYFKREGSEPTHDKHGFPTRIIV